MDPKIRRNIQNLQKSLNALVPGAPAPRAVPRKRNARGAARRRAGGERDVSTRITHKAYLGQVRSAVDFQLNRFPINAGMACTFQWLAPIANQFETYTFRSLSFEYVPSCSALTDGTVTLAVDYDSADSPPQSRQALLTFRGAKTGPLREALSLQCGPELRQPYARRFTRDVPLVANLDIKTYDVGNLIVSAQNSAGNVGGDLYVVYDVDLFTPQMPTEPALAASAKVETAMGPSNAFFGQDIQAIDVDGGLPIVFPNVNTIRLGSVGSFLMDMDITTQEADGNGFGFFSGTPNATITRLEHAIKGDGAGYNSTFGVEVPPGGADFTFNIENACRQVTKTITRLAPFARALF